jgi:hypothetical protein
MLPRPLVQPWYVCMTDLDNSVILFFMFFMNRAEDYFNICSFYSIIWEESIV